MIGFVGDLGGPVCCPARSYRESLMRRWWPKTRLRFRLLLGISLLLAAALPAQAAALYRIDQRYGTIGFSVRVLGLFTVEGRFPSFEGDLLLDTEHPEQSRIDVTIDASAIEMPLPDQADLLRSADYFDAAHYPIERFVSTSDPGALANALRHPGQSPDPRRHPAAGASMRLAGPACGRVSAGRGRRLRR